MIDRSRNEYEVVAKVWSGVQPLVTA